MMNRIKALLGGSSAEESADPGERIQVATCVLLLEMAHADETLHALEKNLVGDLLRRRFDLPQQDVDELMALADRERRQSHDLFQFAKEINAHFSREEKLEIMDTLWRIIYADGVLDKYEDALIRQLATLLRLTHREMIEAKVAVLDELQPGR
jgi:uncharacterized tellurite resistance protein B-like protein